MVFKRPRVDPPPPQEESSLIWKEGAGLTTTGSVLVKLAQIGHYREAQKIIELSHCASLVGRDSDGGFPELWDIMGQRAGIGGITRLMAVCITRGSLSPQRARSLIKDHNADVKKVDDRGRTAMHHALGVRHEIDLNDFFDEDEEDEDDPWPAGTPINIDLIRVLLELDPGCVKAKDVEEKVLLHWACANECDDDVIKFIFDAYPDGLTDEDSNGMIPVDFANPSALIVFARERSVMENAEKVKLVANALEDSSSYEEGRQDCISAQCTGCVGRLCIAKSCHGEQ